MDINVAFIFTVFISKFSLYIYLFFDERTGYAEIGTGRINEVVIIRLIVGQTRFARIVGRDVAARIRRNRSIPARYANSPVSGRAIVRATELRNWPLNHIEMRSSRIKLSHFH